MNKPQYQQGDVSLVRVDSVPVSFQKQCTGQVVLATDINGHAYSLECNAIGDSAYSDGPAYADVPEHSQAATLYSLGNSQYVQLTVPCLLRHQQRCEVRVEPGTYKVRINSQYLHAEHGRTVAYYALLVGKALCFDDQHLRELEFAGKVHDVGFVGCEEVLWKPKWFSSEDWAQVQGHPGRGAKVVATLKERHAAATDRAKQYVLYHHEHLDGSGYPHGIGGDDIPIGARIILIVDAYEALTSWRPFREPLPEHVALDRLWADAGYRFDRKLLELFANALDEAAIAELGI